MSWYKGAKEAWREIIETVAADEHRTTHMVEKDTIHSMILLGLSKSRIPLVFKGGTSLSKAYGLIDRFSEDIDLSMDRRPMESEKKEIKRLIVSIAEDMGLSLMNPENIRSRYSYNKYVFEYESLFSDIPLELIIETSFYQSAYPVEKHTVDSIVGMYCKKRGLILPIPFEAETVQMNVQTLKRTFIDKVFAVCDYKLQDMQDRDSRHIYDIAKVLPEVELTSELDALIDDVREDRMLSRNNPSAQPEHDIPKILKEIIQSRFYESDYNNITKKLLYEDVSYDEAIEQGIAIIAELDIFLYKRDDQADSIREKV